MTKHWTFTGFEQRTRWLALSFVVGMAIIIKSITADISVLEREECDGYRRFKVSYQRGDSYHLGLFNTAAIFVPFFTLIFLNGGIVMMLRKQNVQVRRDGVYLYFFYAIGSRAINQIMLVNERNRDELATVKRTTESQ
ncbi:unnamed protein product [Nippostrongylus brasiliensis]|uniref:G_PROTEIN_RECEP_F1_2 domain-containing protein n=1 Tax=Nippostrongylus brasiliensis TaxID=27835 RepID=A0A0N4Y8F2_NIPBR|nr:unnamed protein product [Nippostrongylus brasiliensis]